MTSVLVTGGAGQIGTELSRIAWGPGLRILAPDRSELDLRSPASISAYFAGHEIAAVVNAAAYTAVDRAESEVGEAFAVNALGPALLADATRQLGVPIVQVSTDYVFAGDKQGPYVEEDPVGPLNVYGASKLAGELAVRTGNPRSVVLRTAWVLSPHRNNFLKTMRRLALSRSEINVVADQFGCPTSAADIAGAIRTVVAAHLRDAAAPCGVYHFVNDGRASWCDLANAIFALRPDHDRPVIARPIAAADYPTAARRPANSVLCTGKIATEFGVRPRPWRDAVAKIVNELERTPSHERQV